MFASNEDWDETDEDELRRIRLSLKISSVLDSSSDPLDDDVEPKPNVFRLVVELVGLMSSRTVLLLLAMLMRDSWFPTKRLLRVGASRVRLKAVGRVGDGAAGPAADVNEDEVEEEEEDEESSSTRISIDISLAVRFPLIKSSRSGFKDVDFS